MTCIERMTVEHAIVVKRISLLLFQSLVHVCLNTAAHWLYPGLGLEEVACPQQCISLIPCDAVAHVNIIFSSLD